MRLKESCQGNIVLRSGCFDDTKAIVLSVYFASLHLYDKTFMRDNSHITKTLTLGKLLLNILISFIIFLVFFGILEGVLRTTHLFNAKTSWVKPDPTLGFRCIPGSKYYHYYENDHPIAGRINSYGWRDKEWSRSKLQDVYRIAVFGDSMVATWDIEIDRTFFALTENQLDKSSEHHTLELMNFGFSTISQAEECLILKNDFVQFSPDMVLLFFPRQMILMT